MRNRKLAPLSSVYAKTPSIFNNKQVSSENIGEEEDDVVDKIVRMDLQRELKSF
jgi:hypothetical protein